MLAIVASHYVCHSGVLQETGLNPSAPYRLYLLLFGMWGKTGINCFVMITGWFLCKGEISLRKFVKLLLEVEVYKVIVGTAFLLAGRLDTTQYLMSLLPPVRNISTNFVGCFLIFYLTIPFLNILIHGMTRRQHRWLLILLLAVYTVWAMVPVATVTYNYVVWFSVIYLIASYIRLYGLYRDDDVRFWTAATVIAIIVATASVIGCAASGGRPWYFVSDSNHLMAVVVAVCSFMMFKNLPMSRVRWVNAVGACTFGVLLIHDNSQVMREWLWRDAVDGAGHLGDWLYPWVAVGTVFAVCAAVDGLRCRWIERPLFRFLDQRFFQKPT